ncbi:hypothetical protein BZZ01_19430 [Nostocales cyanobacterium HT-58-2]|nr:hypothetical protein BZZ01_19430 [Nostocales cyanobacterium HT-58-2]
MALVKLDHYYPEYKHSAFYDITTYEVVALEDEKVGTVASVLVDEDSSRIRYLVVDTGFWLFGKKVLLPIALACISYMDRHVYVEGLTKEQVKALPEYTDNILVDPEYEEKIRSILRPLIAEVAHNQVYNPATYNLDQEPYFYETNDLHLKEVEKQLVARKKHAPEQG